MTVIHTNDPSVIELARYAFPSYTGKKYKVISTDRPVGLKSYWDGGTKYYHKVINLETREIIEVPENGTVFNKNFENKTFPCPGIAVVTHSIVQGKDFGITVVVHPDNMNKFLIPQQAVPLNTDEVTVLYATRALKSSYGGVSNFRFHESRKSVGITEERWNVAIESLIEKGLLNKRKAITNEGKNAISEYGIDSFCTLKEYIKNKTYSNS